MSERIICRDRPWDASFDSAVCAYFFVSDCIYNVQRWLGLPDWCGFVVSPKYEHPHFASLLWVLFVLVGTMPPFLLALAKYAMCTEPDKVGDCRRRLYNHWIPLRRQTAFVFFVSFTVSYYVSYENV